MKAGRAQLPMVRQIRRGALVRTAGCSIATLVMALPRQLLGAEELGVDRH